MAERWGKKYVDKRDWKRCNQKLVDRGGFLLDQSLLEKWKAGLGRLNEGKYGRHYKFPDELIYWAAMQHVLLGMPYRQIQGYLEVFFQGTGLDVPHFTTLHKRIQNLKFDIEIAFKKRGIQSLSIVRA